MTVCGVSGGHRKEGPIVQLGESRWHFQKVHPRGIVPSILSRGVILSRNPATMMDNAQQLFESLRVWLWEHLQNMAPKHCKYNFLHPDPLSIGIYHQPTGRKWMDKILRNLRHPRMMCETKQTMVSHGFKARNSFCPSTCLHPHSNVYLDPQTPLRKGKPPHSFGPLTHFQGL